MKLDLLIKLLENERHYHGGNLDVVFFTEEEDEHKIEDVQFYKGIRAPFIALNEVEPKEED